MFTDSKKVCDLKNVWVFKKLFMILKKNFRKSKNLNEIKKMFANS